MADNNPQSIKAIENIESTTLDIPGQVALLTQLVDIANNNAIQAALMANQLLEQQSPYLAPVSVNLEQANYLSPVSNYEFITQTVQASTK